MSKLLSRYMLVERKDRSGERHSRGEGQYLIIDGDCCTDLRAWGTIYHAVVDELLGMTEPGWLWIIDTHADVRHAIVPKCQSTDKFKSASSAKSADAFQHPRQPRD